jgi:membrane glycosyltransferase
VGALIGFALVLAGNVWLTLWMAPLAVALLTSPAQSVWTSRADLGRAARARGLFLTADDTAQAPELAELAQIRGLPAAPAPLRQAPREPAIWLAADEA